MNEISDNSNNPNENNNPDEIKNLVNDINKSDKKDNNNVGGDNNNNNNNLFGKKNTIDNGKTNNHNDSKKINDGGVSNIIDNDGSNIIDNGENGENNNHNDSRNKYDGGESSIIESESNIIDRENQKDKINKEIKISENSNDNIVKSDGKIIIGNYQIDINEAKKKIIEKFNKSSNKRIFDDFINSFRDITSDMKKLCLEMEVLVPEEIEKGNIITNEILLIDEESLYNYKSFISYYVINKLRLINKKERENYLISHIKDFYKLYLFYNHKINAPDNISLIQNYSDYINNKDKQLSYILLNPSKINNHLIRDNKIKEKIIFFMYKDESYLYFYESKKIVKIRENFYHWNLMEHHNDKNYNKKILEYYINQYKKEKFY